MQKEERYATITEAARYPFKRVYRLFYGLWLLIPIFGQILFIGYLIKILRSVIKETDEEPPEMGSIKKNLHIGMYFVIILGIYFVLMMLLGFINSFAGFLTIPIILLSIYINLAMPVMYAQLAEKNKLSAGLNIAHATKIIFLNLKAYIILLLKQLVLLLIWTFATLPIITVIFSIPAWLYSANFLYADFYKKAKKPRK